MRTKSDVTEPKESARVQRDKFEGVRGACDGRVYWRSWGICEGLVHEGSVRFRNMMDLRVHGM